MANQAVEARDSIDDVLDDHRSMNLLQLLDEVDHW